MTLSTVTVSGTREDALGAERLGSLGDEALASFLASRRWFAGKGRAIDGVRVRDVIPLFPGSVVARLDVLSGPALTTYQLPLVARPSTEAAGGLARIESSEGEGVILDAAADLVFLESLGRAFEAGMRFAGAGACWTVDAAGRPFDRPRPIAAEQSNSSVVYGDEAILKLYRRLLPGIQPDVEIGAFLAARGFAHVPRLFGAIRFEDADGSTTVAGSLQEFVPSRGDAWSAALESARAASASSGSFSSLAADLGRATAALHATLASARDDPAFVPEPIREAEIEALAARVETQIDRSLLLAERSRGAAARLAGRRDEAIRLGRALSRRLVEDAGLAIRHHGDFHLGQVLVARDGRVVIVDFEGEPAKPLAERRARASALRDVSGMLRSFGYAAHVAATEAGGGEEPRARTRRWEGEARGAFLDAYLEGAATGDFLPRAADALRAGLALFELEKAFYELEYELENRPTWIAVPIAAIERILGT